MACFDFRFKRKMNYRHHVVQIVGDIPEIYKVKIYSYNELRTATNNFSSSNKIGQGGFGSVYKGKLKNGLVVALKVLSSESQQGVKEFLNELSAISSVMHENLVILYGCCLEQDQRILVYKYLPNNSLAQTLLGGTRCNINFSWQIRAKICIGVARGLAFLHEERIVHRDIKASNILLDKDLTPKISDFGLAKLFPPNMTHVSTRVAGTLGYLAPEYAIRGQLTMKADIYSFGVLLIEIVSGRCNTSEELFLLEKAWVLYEQDKLSCLVDPSLNGNFNSREVCRFLKVGLLCTQDTPKIRPAMSKVVKMLIGQIDADVAIMKPGLISDFMDLKIRTHDTVELNLSNESPSNSGNSTNMPCSPYIGAEK